MHPWADCSCLLGDANPAMAMTAALWNQQAMQMPTAAAHARLSRAAGPNRSPLFTVPHQGIPTWPLTDETGAPLCCSPARCGVHVNQLQSARSNRHTRSSLQHSQASLLGPVPSMQLAAHSPSRQHHKPSTSQVASLTNRMTTLQVSSDSAENARRTTVASGMANGSSKNSTKSSDTSRSRSYTNVFFPPDYVIDSPFPSSLNGNETTPLVASPTEKHPAGSPDTAISPTTNGTKGFVESSLNSRRTATKPLSLLTSTTSPLPVRSESPTTPSHLESCSPVLLFADRRWQPTKNSQGDCTQSPSSCGSPDAAILGLPSMNGIDQLQSPLTSPVTPLMPPPDIPPPQPVIAHCTWFGELQQRLTKIPPTYSTKIFLGGVPWDITEGILLAAFRPFGVTKVEWPGKESKHTRHPPKGYVYLLFESELGVQMLVHECRKDNNGRYYYTIPSRRTRCSEVQVIPWNLADSNSVQHSSHKMDPSKTVFVGGLHGLTSADDLGHIMNDLFGGVVYAGVDTDRYKYPIGSGRVTFSNTHSYMKAVMAAFVEIKTNKFTKKVQVDPYLEDKPCSQCGVHPGPMFCRDQVCFKYFCNQCWQWQHSVHWLRNHRPISRSNKHQSGSDLVSGETSPTN